MLWREVLLFHSSLVNCDEILLHPLLPYFSHQHRIEAGFIIFQDYTENLQKNSDDKILNLFQRKYVHLLIVSSVIFSYVFPSCVT